MSDIDVTPHPAKFNEDILLALYEVLFEHAPAGWVVDPFGGVGTIHELPFNTFHIELEPEWEAQAAQRGPGVCMDFFEWWPDTDIDAFVTSPTYGNRMADNHTPKPEDKSRRITYRHSLGRELDPMNSGGMQWGDDYREFHADAWRQCYDIVVPGGLLVLNLKDHIRAGKKMPVVAWHRAICTRIGWRFVKEVKIPAKGMGFGANGQVRVDHEVVVVFQKPEGLVLP